MDSEFDKELNAEWVRLNQEMQRLNHERRNVLEKYKAEHPGKEMRVKWESTPSMYYDFFGNDIDIYKR